MAGKDSGCFCSLFSSNNRVNTDWSRLPLLFLRNCYPDVRDVEDLGVFELVGNCLHVQSEDASCDLFLGELQLGLGVGLWGRRFPGQVGDPCP